MADLATRPPDAETEEFRDRPEPPEPWDRPLTAVEERILAVRRQLRAQIGPIYKLPGNNGANYHTGEQVIAWLNDVLGEENWTTRILDRWREPDSDEVCVSLELECVIWVPDQNDPETAIRQMVRHQDIGGQQIKRSSKSITDQDGNVTAVRLPLSIADDYKSAVTDAIKRCAKLLSVGLYLWEKSPTIPYRRSDEEEEARAALAARPTGRPARPAPDPEPSPRPTIQRSLTELRDLYRDALSLATGSGFRAEWTGRDVDRLTRDEIIAYGKQLRAHNDGVSARQATVNGAA